MKISVIIPAYNAEKTIGAAIKSAVSQASEVIVVDDGSNDWTAEAASAWPVKVIKSPDNMGPGAARNIGIEASSGDFLLFLDADDRLGKNQVGALLSTLNDAGADAAWCPTLLVHRGHARLVAPPDFEAFFLSGESLPIHSMLTRRDKCPPFDPAWAFEDREWASRMLVSGLKFAFVPDAACLYSLGEPKPRQRLFAPECRRIRKRLRNWLLSPDGGRKDENRAFALACANLRGAIHDVCARGGEWNDDARANISRAAGLLQAFMNAREDSPAERFWMLGAFHLWKLLGQRMPEMDKALSLWPYLARLGRDETLERLSEMEIAQYPPKKAMLEVIRRDLEDDAARLARRAWEPFRAKKAPVARLDAEGFFTPRERRLQPGARAPMST